MTQMDCSGVLKVTLALAAAPDISSNPTDIVLILDRSGSMSGSPPIKVSGPQLDFLIHYLLLSIRVSAGDAYYVQNKTASLSLPYQMG